MVFPLSVLVTGLPCSHFFLHILKILPQFSIPTSKFCNTSALVCISLRDSTTVAESWFILHFVHQTFVAIGQLLCLVSLPQHFHSQAGTYSVDQSQSAAALKPLQFCVVPLVPSREHPRESAQFAPRCLSGRLPPLCTSLSRPS